MFVGIANVIGDSLCLWDVCHIADVGSIADDCGIADV